MLKDQRASSAGLPIILRLSRLWSDPVALEIGYDQTQVRSNQRPIRLKCARIRLLSDSSALESSSNQTRVPSCARNCSVISSAQWTGLRSKWSGPGWFRAHASTWEVNHLRTWRCRVFFRAAGGVPGWGIFSEQIKINGSQHRKVGKFAASELSESAEFM